MTCSLEIYQPTTIIIRSNKQNDHSYELPYSYTRSYPKLKPLNIEVILLTITGNIIRVHIIRNKQKSMLLDFILFYFSVKLKHIFFKLVKTSISTLLDTYY